ncbi:hypothetical protein ACFX2I_010924 [Malus domestica]
MATGILFSDGREQTWAMADLASPACNLETRKTAPGLRLVDCGQDWWRSESQNNGLFDMVMIKDNHITIAGGITNAVKSVDLNLQMEVEVIFGNSQDLYYNTVSPVKRSTSEGANFLQFIT